MAIFEVSIIPLGTGTASVSKYLAKAVALLKEEEGIQYELTAMGTILQGDLSRLFGLVQRMHEAIFDIDVSRVVTTIKIDDRRDKAATMTGKVESVRAELEHEA